MVTATIEEAQARLAQFITELQPGEELVITESGRPVARLITESRGRRRSRRLGTAVGILKINAEDEEHLEDFREYVP
jgi:prevent-host-death family protein